MRAVIIVPAFGKDAGSFLVSAKAVLHDIYHKKGVIFKVNAVNGGNGQTLFNAVTPIPEGMSSDHYQCVQAAGRYIVISHMGEIDGPMLGSEGSTIKEYQPWGCTSESLAETEQGRMTGGLSMMGYVHWTTVGRARSNKILIALLGCNSAVTYSGQVARCAQSVVWGTANACSTGIPSIAKAAMQQIESGRETSTFRKMSPYI